MKVIVSAITMCNCLFIVNFLFVISGIYFFGVFRKSSKKLRFAVSLNSVYAVDDDPLFLNLCINIKI